MKKLIASLGIILMLPLSALAANPESLIDENTDIFFTLDAEKMDTNMKLLYDSLLKQVQYGGIDPLEKYLLEIISNGKISLAITEDSNNQSTAAFVEMTEAAFDKMIELYSPKESEVNKGFYTADNTEIFTYHQGNFTTADNETELLKIVSSTENKLGESDNYKIAQAKLSDDAFINFHINLESLLSEIIGEENEGNLNILLNSLISTSAAIRQSENGFGIESYTSLDSQKLTENGMDYDNLDELELYKLMPKRGVIYFYNANSTSNIKKLIETEAYKELKNDLQKEFNIDPTDLIMVLEEETAFLMQDTGDILPSFTFMANLKDNEEKVQSSLDNIIALFWNKLETEADSRRDNTVSFSDSDGTLSITKQNVTIEKQELDQFIVKYKIATSKNPYAPIINEDLLTLKITAGVIDDVLVLSTNKNIDKEYGEGVYSNNEIKKLIDKKTDGIFYFNPANLNEYIQNILIVAENTFSEDLLNLNNEKEILNKIFAPWGSINATMDLSNTYISSHTDINVDLGLAIRTYNQDLFSNNNSFDNLSTINNSQKDYSDLHNQDWYNDDVYYLSTKGVIKGYSDGEFKPNKSINRAEFTKLIIKTLEANGYIDSTYDYSISMEDSITDIEEYSWYEQPVGKARKAGIISGYKDKTFRPEANISRAEAAQVIANIIKIYRLKSTLPKPPNFRDVKSTDWYFNAINTVSSNRIMTGKNEQVFAPNKNLTRAEAAKIIRNLLRMIENTAL